MNIHVTNIVWDADGEDADLPNELVIDTVAEDIEASEDQVADWMSNKYGWCVMSFSQEVEPGSALPSL